MLACIAQKSLKICERCRLAAYPSPKQIDTFACRPLGLSVHVLVFRFNIRGAELTGICEFTGGKLISTTVSPTPEPPFNAAEMGMLAHLYRGEMYRSKVWRTRLDATTNWAVATTGIALSVAFSSAGNSPLPLVLVALMAVVFLTIEARRYRYFDIWRTRVRMMEVSMYAPLLRLQGIRIDNGWNEELARDYEHLHFHISFWEAAGRRLRRNYSFLFLVQAVSYAVKICIHPTPVRSLRDLWEHASIGPLSGEIVLAVGVLFHTGLVALALLTLKGQRAAGRVDSAGNKGAMANLRTD
jgi:uncharacterized membrane protein